MTDADTPDIATILVTHEDRLNQLEYEVGVLQGRMPKSKLRRVFWWMRSTLLLAVPIVGGVAALFVDDPWKQPIVVAAFGFVIGKTVTDFARFVSQGPRPHRSVLMEDHR